VNSSPTCVGSEVFVTLASRSENFTLLLLALIFACSHWLCGEGGERVAGPALRVA
jgi:hypothetical protein